MVRKRMCRNMGQIHIVTDSTSDLTPQEIAEHNIHVVPLTIQIDEATYVDGVDIQPEEFMGKMAAAKVLPKSSQPAPGKFKELYDELGKDGDQIISIHMTGNPIPQLGMGDKLIGTDVYLLDKLNGLSTELGFAEYTSGSRF